MKNFLLSLRFVIKRVFRLTAANIAWLICFAAVIAALTVVMAAVTEIRGSEDYPFYLATEPSACHRCIQTFMQASISVQAGFTSVCGQGLCRYFC